MKLFFFSPLLLQKMIWIPTRVALLFFGHLRIYGLENLEDLPTNAIFACNHSSELDPILVPAALPFWSKFSPMFYTSREEKFYENSGWRRHFYGGTFFKAWGSYPVFTGLKNYEKSLAHHISIIRAGGSVCVFPEGRITRDGNIQQAKGGVAFLSYATRTPIIPVRFDGTYKRTFGEFLLRRCRLSVTFGKPVYIAEKTGAALSINDFKTYANQIMDCIRHMRPQVEMEQPARHEANAGAAA